MLPVIAFLLGIGTALLFVPVLWVKVIGGLMFAVGIILIVIALFMARTTFLPHK
jgi:hypothetical protein